MGRQFLNGRFLLLLLCFSVFSFRGLCDESTVSQKDYLLILNTYNADAPWSEAIISPVVQKMAAIKEIDVFVNNLNLLLVDDASELDRLVLNLFQNYSYKAPRAILLLGNSSLILRDRIRQQWGDVPMVLCGEDDFTGPDSDYLAKRPIPVSRQIPLHEISDKYNLTLLNTKIYLRESIELMKHMIPGMKKLILLGDQRFSSQQINYDMVRLIDDSYKDMEYEFISADDISTDELMFMLNNVDTQTTGVIYSSWFRKKVLPGNMVLISNSFRVIVNTPTPVFALNNYAISGNGMIGGYVYDQKRFDDHLSKVLDKVLYGTPARDVPFYVPQKAGPVFNYPTLVNKGFTASDCPPGSVFLDRSQSLLQKYWYWFLIFGISIVWIFLVIMQRARIKSLDAVRSAQDKELKANQALAGLFDNMPISYLREHLVRNDSGEIVDVEVCEVNNHFFGTFMTDKTVVGMKGSELFGSDFKLFLRYLRILDTEKRTISFMYYLEIFDKYLNVVLAQAAQDGYIDVFCVDSTELNRAQQKLDDTNHKLSMAIEVANITPWKWDLVNRTILCDVNRQTPQGDIAGETNEEPVAVPQSRYFDKIHSEDRPRVEQAYNDLIEGKVSKVKEEYRIICEDKKQFHMDWVEVQAAVETSDKNGAPQTLVGSSLVISGRKKMEQDLLDAKNRAEESNRLKTTFLANMSHEIRTPLNAIVGFSGILPTVEEPEEREEYINIIESNNTLLLQLIGDILDLSKIESGAFEFNYTPTDLNELLTEIERSTQLRAEPKGLVVSFGDSVASCNISTDKNRLTQVLTNLIVNAIKFTEQGSITFGYEVIDGMVRFYVTDTGCGIAKDKAEAIFSRFVKLNSFAQGTGLGLSICRMILDKMGGEIGVESEEGVGSTFRFTIPYLRVDKEDSQQQEECEMVSVRKDQLTILIAEDNASNFKLFETILKNDFRIVHAWDGQQAVDLFREHNPHLVLMDINMPVKNGYEATREIKAIAPKVPIIAVTAYAYASDEKQIEGEGFDGYVPKPINAKTMKSKIAELLNKRLVLL